jgi:DNA sulfur modification protein DndC
METTMIKELNLFGNKKISIAEAQQLTIESINEYGIKHDHWVIAWSGGKDSTCTMTLIMYLIKSGQVNAPKKVTVLYADTRMELPPLAISALSMIEQIKQYAVDFPCKLEVETVLAPLDKRYFVYMFGRGVPPPNNNTLRWCTRSLKVDPMQKRIEQEFFSLNPGLIDTHKSDWDESLNKPLTITGVRIGESSIRDGRIVLSCSKDGAECGQGWYQNEISGSITSTLAPITHWRVCTVWDWLKIYAPMPEIGGWKTEMLAEAYGGDKSKEINARTGCNGCPLANNDTALDSILNLYPDEWGYLRPLKKLRPLYRELRKPQYRLRKHGELNNDGAYSSSPNRMGPLTMEARKYGLRKIIEIESEINKGAERLNRPMVDLINAEEIERIEFLIDQNTWPNRWTGKEPVASQPYEEIDSKGNIQKNIFI